MFGVRIRDRVGPQKHLCAAKIDAGFITRCRFTSRRPIASSEMRKSTFPAAEQVAATILYGAHISRAPGTVSTNGAVRLMFSAP
jgi:hypothetical protein